MTPFSPFANPEGVKAMSACCIKSPALGASALLLLGVIVLETFATHHPYYTGGLPLPYMSDLARDGVRYRIFVICAVVPAVLLLCQHSIFSVRYAHQVHDRIAVKGSPPPILATWIAGCALTSIALVGLGTLACASVAEAPVLHFAATHVFLDCTAAGMLAFVVALFLIRRAQPSAIALCSFEMKLLLTFLFWLSFLVYWIGFFALPSACRAGVHLRYADCVRRYNLTEAFCAAHVSRVDLSEAAALSSGPLPSVISSGPGPIVNMRAPLVLYHVARADTLSARVNATQSGGGARPDALTSLLDYSDCEGLHTLRAAAQLACLLLAAIFHGTFALEDGVLQPLEQLLAPASARAAHGDAKQAKDPKGDGVKRMSPAAPPDPAKPLPGGAAPSRRASAGPAEPGAEASWAEERLKALYDFSEASDPEAVRNSLPRYAAGATPPRGSLLGRRLSGIASGDPSPGSKLSRGGSLLRGGEHPV